MTFLALTPLQVALLALLVSSVIIALYFLKLRHRRVFVSSSILWRKVLDEQQSHSLWEKLRKIISVVIAVTIALLIALALSRPEVESLTGRNERIVIVLDTSPTMNTRTSDGRTRWEHAIAEANNLLASGGPTTEFRILDTSGSTASPSTTDRGEARDLIAAMSPRSAEPRFPRVDGEDSQVYLVSDGVAVRDVPEFAKRISVFEPAANVGITAFEIRSIPSTPLGYEAYLEVQNYGKSVAEVSLTLSGTGGQRINRTMRLTAGEAIREIFDLTKFEGGGVRATIQAKDDGLQMDDVAFAYLPIKRKTRTLLVTRGNNYLETVLKLDPYVELTVTDPAAYKEAANIDVYVFDRYAPVKAPPRPALIIGTPDAPWLKPALGTVQKPEITTWAEDHPLMQYVSVHDISIERATRIDTANLSVIAASSQTPLIVASDKPRWVMLTFDLDGSDFPLQVGFPVFIENVLTWFSREQLAIRRTPGTVEVPFANAQIQTVDGQTVESQQQLGKTLFHAAEPGLYAVHQGETRNYVAVNLASRTFSAVNQSVFENDTVAASQANWLRRELWFYMLLAAVVLISVEWFTYHRRITL